MNAVDTNVLIYAHDPRDSRKQAIAASLIRSQDDGLLVWQVACEFVAASRKLQLFGFAETMAFEEIGALRRVWSTVTPDWNALDLAGRLQQRFSLSFWDALLIASSIEAGAGRLYSEDFGGCRMIESLEIVNPFAAA